MPDVNKNVYNQNLLLTQAYCELQLKENLKNSAEIFRSINLEYNGKPLFSYKKGEYFETIWQIDPIMGHYRNFYDEIFVSQLKTKKDTIQLANDNKEFLGKILIADIDYTVVDGASEAETEGFIDINDCPPIDTWFYISSEKYPRKLFAWIPEQYVNVVNKGIEVNCVDCFYWYDVENPSHNNLIDEIYRRENISKKIKSLLNLILITIKKVTKNKKITVSR